MFQQGARDKWVQGEAGHGGDGLGHGVGYGLGTYGTQSWGNWAHGWGGWAHAHPQNDLLAGVQSPKVDDGGKFGQLPDGMPISDVSHTAMLNPLASHADVPAKVHVRDQGKVIRAFGGHVPVDTATGKVHLSENKHFLSGIAADKPDDQMHPEGFHRIVGSTGP